MLKILPSATYASPPTLLYAFAMYYSSNLNPFCTLPSLGTMGKVARANLNKRNRESERGEIIQNPSGHRIEANARVPFVMIGQQTG